jgi:nuclear cap-binding protein subunit 1
MSSYNNYNRNGNNDIRKRKMSENGGGYEDDDQKRQRTNLDSSSNGNTIVEDELEATLARLGEQNEKNLVTNFSIEGNIETVTDYVLEQIVHQPNEVINYILEFAHKLPEKLSYYTTLIGLVNIKNPNFVEKLIDGLATHLKNYLKSGNFFILHRLIRFASDLVNVNVLSTLSILNIYKKFIAAIDEEEAPQVRNDFYVYCVLSSIPWNGKKLYESHGPVFDELLEKIRVYITNRQRDYLNLLKVWTNDDPHPQEEYLDCIWIQIKKLEENDWKENQIYRPYVKFANYLSQSTVLHEFPMITPTEYSSTESRFPLPRTIFRMFDYTDVPEEYILPGAHSIERFLVEEQLHSVINTYYLDRKLCASKLLKLNVSNRIPLNYIIVEVT